jgi:hypothetical protein
MLNLENRKLGGKRSGRKNKDWCKNNKVTSKIIMKKCKYVKVCDKSEIH